MDWIIEILNLEVDPERLKLARNETKILKSLDHENIVKYHFEIIVSNVRKQKGKNFALSLKFARF